MASEESSSKAKNPLKAILDIQRGEWPLALSMFGYFFLVITTFWILKPIKKSIFIEFYAARGGVNLGGWQLGAAQAELIAKVGNMVVAFGAVIAFTMLARRLQREQLSLTFSAFFAATLAFYALTIDHGAHWLAWSFYLYGDLYSTLMVATFFAFLNDSVTPQAAKRLYGLIVLGGVGGGAFGTSVLNVFIDEISRPTWIWICLGISAVIALLALYAGRLVKSGAVEAPEDPSANDPEPNEKQQNAALEGARLVFRSPYLLSIVAIVGTYEIVSTIMDFQFTSTVAHYLKGEEIGRHFTLVFNITNVAGLVVQLLLTTFILNRFRLSVALLVTPVVILSASTGFLALPILWMGSMLNTADNAFSYSINQSARETLYTPTSRDEKYKAKAFIDMFVQRFAKALAVGVSLIVTSIFKTPDGGVAFAGVRWLSFATIAFALIWALSALYAGRHFRRLTKETEK